MKKFNLILTLLAGLTLISGAAQAKCVNNVASKNPDDFVFMKDRGTFIDLSSGLEWKSCLEGQYTKLGDKCDYSKKHEYSWGDALALTDVKNGWRLPNLKEAASLLVTQCDDGMFEDGDFKDYLHAAVKPMPRKHHSNEPRQIWTSTGILDKKATHAYVLTFNMRGLDIITKEWTVPRSKDKHEVLMVRDLTVDP